ncbi:DUF4238 domain-containing protein [Acidithiobacillus ferrooxidans]|uniref:DUF4238 domain-containing protein n=1 Tax=Acidithiobacillus ferrooxidans TaxID=920 RepID=UPI002147E678|nr:DUF4238 domain-containing protein [Acidithiobacillus ferrooxidans]MCR1344894.1 DUF4238 domain-containing protein [Acidithiobacillus ferrooxidans]MCR1353384.1 DUF4238 domain-containing protein [Acidithiobacillus ferrooxidans]
MVSAELNTKNQHYVWRHYLNAWTVDSSFCCYRQKDKKLFQTQPKAIASETYFYEIQQLTDGDMVFLEDIISRTTNERLRELNRDYVKMTQIPFQLRELLKNTDLNPEARVALEEKLRWAKRNLIERYHTGIENKCQDILDSLRNMNDAFYKDEVRCGDFLHFLSHQSFRTAKMRDGLSKIPNYILGHAPRRTANILNHILATNVSVGLFRERNAYRIIFLTNDTLIPFVTGDQPVLNMLDPEASDNIELYYPLSPNLAVIVTKDAARFPDRKRGVTTFEVERYNYAIYCNSEDQIYSSESNYLGCLVAMEKHVLAT